VDVFKEYGRFYDIFYSDKDYEEECDFLEEIFKRYAPFKPRTILDGGCGTGGHVIPLAKRGYDMTGVDVSGEMICLARENAVKMGVKPKFNVMDLRELELDKKFDVCISMFSVIGYITDNKDLSKTLQNIRNCLKKGALFIFDFWYGPSVLSLRPTARIKNSEKKGIRVIRFSEPTMDTFHHICKVNYYWIVTKENLVVYKGKEKHAVRFYFPEEIKHYLEESGFQLLRFCPFLDLNTQPSEKTWNVTAIAQAV